MPKKTWNISPEANQLLQELRPALGVGTETAAVEAAIRHLHSTLDRGEPVYYARPGPRPPKKPKAA